LTFDHAAEKVSDGDSGRSRVVTIARQRIPAERLHPKATNWRSRPILLKNSVSAQGRKISGDMARPAREVPRAYRPTAIASRKSSRFASAKACPQLSISMPGIRKSARSGKPSFSTA
jgi:hypothetical protein